jgi:hypothetical protein
MRRSRLLLRSTRSPEQQPGPRSPLGDEGAAMVAARQTAEVVPSDGSRLASLPFGSAGVSNRLRDVRAGTSSTEVKLGVGRVHCRGFARASRCCRSVCRGDAGAPPGAKGPTPRSGRRLPEAGRTATSVGTFPAGRAPKRLARPRISCDVSLSQLAGIGRLHPRISPLGRPADAGADPARRGCQRVRAFPDPSDRQGSPDERSPIKRIGMVE